MRIFKKTVWDKQVATYIADDFEKWMDKNTIEYQVRDFGELDGVPFVTYRINITTARELIIESVNKHIEVLKKNNL